MNKLKIYDEAEEFRLHLEQLGYAKIITCKECSYWSGYECNRNKISNVRVITDEYDYCSRAKRKDNG